MAFPYSTKRTQAFSTACLYYTHVSIVFSSPVLFSYYVSMDFRYSTKRTQAFSTAFPYSTKRTQAFSTACPCYTHVSIVFSSPVLYSYSREYGIFDTLLNILYYTKPALEYIPRSCFLMETEARGFEYLKHPLLYPRRVRNPGHIISNVKRIVLVCMSSEITSHAQNLSLYLGYCGYFPLQLISGAIPDSIRQLTKLTRLHLFGNWLTGESMR